MKKQIIVNSEMKVLHIEDRIAKNGNKYMLVHALVTFVLDNGETFEQVRKFTLFKND